jgi:serine/threonine protein kinase
MTDQTLGDRYVVRGFIGCGGMARVYLAVDEKTGRPVAVKVMEPPYCDDASARERFMRETTTITQIGHPSIVALLEAGEREDDGAPYLVMEFLYGESLGDFLKRERTMANEPALAMLRRTASALAAAHRKGIIHRDLKPDNLYLIGEPGDAYGLKVIDFGLSKVQTQDMTAAGVVMGTPEYMAPEQVLAETVDARTDVYGLGLVMYRMLIGSSPFDAGDGVDIIAQQVHKKAKLPAGFDGRAALVIATAIRKAPNERYPEMDIMFDDLGKLDDPKARLWASKYDTPDHYEPTSEIGRQIAKALGRVVAKVSGRTSH